MADIVNTPNTDTKTSVRQSLASKPEPPSPGKNFLGIRHAMVVPLIVACAMFMEMVDANVITTALPLIARDFGKDPQARTLRLSDKSGGFYTDFRVDSRSLRQSGGVLRRHHDLHGFVHVMWPGAILRLLCRASIHSGHRRSDDGPGRPHCDCSHGREGRPGNRVYLSYDTGNAWALDRSRLGRIYRNLFQLALDFLHQCPDKHCGNHFRPAIHGQLP